LLPGRLLGEPPDRERRLGRAQNFRGRPLADPPPEGQWGQTRLKGETRMLNFGVS
jgi:hypothetical protein